MPTNEAAFQPRRQASTLEVRSAPYPTPANGQIVICNAAVAVNPIDMMIQRRGNIMFTHLRYPFVLGYDMAGEVAAVGDGVSRFHIGDRVLAFSRAGEKMINDPAQGAFQKYAVVYEDLATELPVTVDFAHAATLPLALATAAAALFDKAQLGLLLPTAEPRREPSGAKGVVVVWGASTSVGCNAVQLAAAAGCEVFATAGAANHERVRRLGAARVWDYKSATAVDDIAGALQDKVLAGIVSIGSGAAEKCIQLVDKVPSGSGNNKHIAMATFPLPDKEPQSLVFLRTAASYMSSLLSYRIRGAVRGFTWSLVDIGPTLDNGVARHIFAEFLPKALAAGAFVPAPEPEIVGHGLGNIQLGFGRLQKGVSFKKLVVTI